MTSEISLVVTNTSTFIKGSLESEYYHALKKELGYLPENAVFALKHNQQDPNKQWAKDWDGRITTVCYNKSKCRCPVKKDGTHFPTGLLSKVTAFLKQAGVPYKIYDKRDPVIKTLDLSTDKTQMKERDYQHIVIEDSIKRERGVIKMATGSGKTATSAGIIARLGVAPFIFYVTSKDLMNQAKNELSKFILQSGKNLEVGVIGDGKCDIRDVNVMTVQTAIRACGAKYKKYDDEEEYTKEKEISDTKRKDIFSLITSAKGIMCDECLTGDSIVYTEYGKTRIDEIENKKCKKVLSYKDGNILWCNISGFLQRGKKKVIEIELESGRTLRCTRNHPVMTLSGWKEAGCLKPEDKILGLASVGVDQEYTIEDKDISLDTGEKKDQNKNGKRYTIKQKWMPHTVNADVAKRSIQWQHLWKCLLNMEDTGSIVSSVILTTKDRKNGESNLVKEKNRQYLGHYLETHQSRCLLKEVKIQGYPVITESSKKSGCSTRQLLCKDYLPILANKKIEDSEISLSTFTQEVFPAYKIFIKSLNRMAEKLLLENGLTELGISDLHGGYAMTDVGLDSLLFILKGILLKNKKLYQNGSQKTSGMSGSLDPKINTIISLFHQKLEKKYLSQLEDIYRSVCSTNYDSVISVTDCGEEHVYDINVEHTHCFFANGLLVHNCQHWKADTCTTISDYSLSARYKFGLSATPFRDEGDDILIDSCFGRQICDINASYLIAHKNKYLVKPDIYFVPVKNMRGKKFDTYATAYKEAIVENPFRNDLIVKIANNFASQGRVILILCRQIAHGEMLESLIPGSVFLHGSHSSKIRKEHLEKMRQRKSPITISTSIFDEGIDCCPLDTLILAGSGKSTTRALQRVGRILRPYPGKEDAIVVDFEDHCKYMYGHSHKRRSIYETEPEFNIETLNIS